jgi:methylated-DNA-protein-cysteine methyltransferase-like protein
MAGAATFAQVKAQLLDLVARIPPGRVAIHKDLGVYLGVPPHHVAFILTTLSDVERAQAAWWRVVADGGAVGRHDHRDAQIARLKADGLVLSGVGIVQDLAKHKVGDLAALARGPIRDLDEAPPPPPEPAKSRARGMKDRPTSS